MRECEMLKVTKCIPVNSFVEALMNMVCELKITSGQKKKKKKNYKKMTRIFFTDTLLTYTDAYRYFFQLNQSIHL